VRPRNSVDAGGKPGARTGAARHDARRAGVREGRAAIFVARAAVPALNAA